MISFRFEEIKSGWCCITFRSEEIETEISVSYLTDFMNDLILSTAILLEGSESEVIKCYYEPGQYILSFNKVIDQLTLSIDETRSTGNINIYKGTEQIKKFGRLLLREIERIKNELGIIQYNKNWKYEYPENAIERLRKAIKE